MLSFRITSIIGERSPSERDHGVIIRKMPLGAENRPIYQESELDKVPTEQHYEDQNTAKYVFQFGEVHWLQHLHGCLQECLDEQKGHRIHVVEQCRNQTWHWLSKAVGKTRFVEGGMGKNR